jgi:hypothetical protein
MGILRRKIIVAASLAAAVMIGAYSPVLSIIQQNRWNYEGELNRKKAYLERIITAEQEELPNTLGDAIAPFYTPNFEKDSDEVLLARMILGEEGLSKIEKIGVASTVLNRMEYNGKTLKETILELRAYSCFNKNAPIKMKKALRNPLRHYPEEFLMDLVLAKEIQAGKYEYLNIKATDYYNPSLVKQPSYWDDVILIGKVPIENKRLSEHIFGIDKRAKSKPLSSSLL